MKIGYYLFHPDDLSTPVYVGVGSKERGENHWKEYRHRRVKNKAKDAFYRDLDVQGRRPVWSPVASFETLEEALAWEVSEISRIGRKDLGLGPLLNRTNGGDNRGRVFDSERREQLRAAVWENPEVCKRISEKNKLIHNTPALRETHRRNTEIQMSDPAARKRLSESAKKMWADPDTRKRMLDGLRKAGQTEESFQNRSKVQAAVKNLPHQKERAARKQRQYLASLTPEQKAERIEKIKAGMAAARARKLATSVEV